MRTEEHIRIEMISESEDSEKVAAYLQYRENIKAELKTPSPYEKSYAKYTDTVSLMKLTSNGQF